MLPAPTFPAALGGLTGPASWLGLLAFGALAASAGLLWQLWRKQRQYALALAEQARQVAEEEEKARQALAERAAILHESQAKSEMLATLSREIRAHLNGIIGSADLMLDQARKPQDREHLTTLRTSAESLHQSLNDVLDYAKIETGQIRIARAPFDLRQPLTEIIEHLLPLATLKGLELVLIFAPDVPPLVTGDASRLRQALLNLMSSAVRSTAAGRVVLRAELGAAPDGSMPGAAWIHFSVSDTGPGIPEAMQAALFNRFAHSDSPSPRTFGGSGLELAVSKRLVELMGGKISARNLPETGAEFLAMLPLMADKEQPSAAGISLLGCHVVILDSVAASRVALSAMLSRLGVDHDPADTVSQAAEFLRDALDAGAQELVLLLDEPFAQSRGEELARALAVDPVLATTRIVLMSRTPDAVAPDGYGLAITAVVRKPLVRADVLIEACLQSPGAASTRISGSRMPFDTGKKAGPPARRDPVVLVVDDDEISRFVSSQLLARIGCVVELAVSGVEAIQQAGRTRFDLIFMDCQMPEMDGFTATRTIRSAGRGDTPPIVALTANASPADRERCFAAGMCDFVSKPVRQPELLRVLKRWIQTPGPESPAVSGSAGAEPDPVR